MKLKLIIYFTLFATIISALFLFKQNAPKAGNTLIIGTAAGYAPFVSINQNGEYEGFDIDIAKQLAKTMNKTLIIKDLGSMAPLFIALEQGTIDAILWGLSITKDRLGKVTMICYQGQPTVSFPMLFWQHVPTSVKSINDMKGMTICVEPASSQDMVLSNYPFINKKQTERVDDALLNIQYGKADAAFVEPAIAQKFKQRYPEIKVMEVPLSPDEQVQGVGIATSKNNIDLQNQLQKAVDELQRTGIIKQLEKKWNIQ